MAADLGKLLERIEADNLALTSSHEQLVEAFQELDSKLNALNAGIRVEPYEVRKGGPVIGFRRYNDGWHISTHLVGLSDMVSEIPVFEAAPAVQVELMEAVGGLLEKISAEIAAQVKAAAAAVKQAEGLLAVLR